MQKHQILIVEDDHGLREALVDTLMLGGYQVTPVDSAENAMNLLYERDPLFFAIDICNLL